jgi:fructokinase
MNKENKIISLGVIILDMFPCQLGVDLSSVKEFRPMPGGACANVAVSVSKFGIKSNFVGKVGDDYFGRFLCDSLEEYDVNTKGLVFDKERRTTMNFHAKPDANSIQYLFYRNPGADTNLKTSDVDFDEIKTAKVLHFDSLCLTDNPTHDTIIEIIKVAKKNNTIVSFDVNYRDVLWESSEVFIKKVNSIFSYVDILKLNETEYELFFGEQELSYGKKLMLSFGPKLLIVTKGKDGSFIGNKNSSVAISPNEVEVVDTIGCGDSYISAFLAYTLKENINILNLSKDEMKRCGLFADTAASLTATKQGAMPALPSYKEVEKIFLQRDI